MFCENCGNRVVDGAKFCEKCGARISYPDYSNGDVETNLNNTLQRKKGKQITLIILAAVIVLAAIIVPVSIASCKANSSLADKLTAHTWRGGGTVTLKFFKDGDVEYSTDTFSKIGKWSVTGTQLKMSSFHSGTYDYWDNLSDTDIDRGVAGSNYYSWYVSDKYFVFCEDCVYGADRTQIYRAN